MFPSTSKHWSNRKATTLPSKSKSSSPSQPSFRLLPHSYGSNGTLANHEEEEESGRIISPEHFQDAGSFSFFKPSIRWIVGVFLLLFSSLVLLATVPLRGSNATKGSTFETTSTITSSSASISDILAAIRAGRNNSTSSTTNSVDTITDSTTTIPTTTTTTTIISTEPLVITSVGDYGDVKASILPYPFLSSSETVFVEPYKETTLSVTNAMTSCAYTWSIHNDKTTTLSYTGDVVTAVVSGTGQYTLSLTEMCDDGNTIGRSITTDLWAKYVRRELLSLADRDREEFLDALQMTYLVNTREGMAKYGPLYKSMYYFTSVHIDAAGNPVCDEFHKGPGFFSNHLYMGNYLEQSLQAVNPRVALHYMEYSTYYTSDAWNNHMKNQLDGGAWTELLSEKWFGRNDPYTGEILDGRWSIANVQIPFVTKQFFADHVVDEAKTFFPVEEEQWLSWSAAHLRSPYGLLRPPWSFNPSRGISRFHNEVGLEVVEDSALSDFFMGADCADYEYFINTDVVGRTFDNYLEKVKEDSHGKIHFNIGGQGGSNARAVDKELMETHGFTQEDIIVITEASQKFGKIYISTRDFYESYEATLKSEVYPIYPMNCSADPWDVTTETASTMDPPQVRCRLTYLPGNTTYFNIPYCYTLNTLFTMDPPQDWRARESSPSPGPGSNGDTNTNPSTSSTSSASSGPSCQCSDYYFTTPTTVQTLINIYFWKYVKNTYAQNITPAKIMAMPFEQQVLVMKLLCSRMAMDGDMVGSASPLDPVFWVSHGAIEKLYQRILFTNLLADTDYTTANSCSGHDPNGQKAWLQGYYFEDKTVDPTLLTNAQLTDLLNPSMGESYQQLIPYVYDKTLIGCPSVDNLLVS